MNETAQHSRELFARSVFAGLKPTSASSPLRRSRGPKRVVYSTVPILLVGSLAAMTLNLTGSVEPVAAKPKPLPSDIGKSLRGAVAKAATAVTAAVASSAAPTTYTVAAGDTVSEIAGKFGLSTASVLALNGLSWSSMIFPGQQLQLTVSGSLPPVAAAPPTESTRYAIVSGDTIGLIAERFGITTASLLTANGLGWDSIIYPGQTLAIPSLGHDQAPALEPVVAVTPIESAPLGEGSTYTILAGDTVSGIAGRFGVSLQSVLDANGLTASSLIFSGETLVIPGSHSIAAPAAASSGSSATLLDAEMSSHAAVIIQVGRELGVSDYGIVIALATAMQESSMRNLDWGDRDSVGLFQQRPSSGWGSVEQLTTPSYSARLFYGGPSNPNAGHTSGLLDVAGWESLPLTVAAQRVQISAYPDAYAKWEDSARAWLAELG